MSERYPIKWLGRILGTGTDSDGDPGQAWWINNFEPSEGVNLPACKRLLIDGYTGLFIPDHTGVAGIVDCIAILKDLPKA